MGGPMTMNLLRSDAVGPVTVYGRHPARLAPFEREGAHIAQSARELAQRSDVILSVLPDLAQLEPLLPGDDGVLAGIERETTLVIASTSSPAAVRELAARLREQTDGVLHTLDAPASGGTDGAENATLSIMVGGASDDLERVLPVLTAMGRPTLLGPIGSGEVAKACNQMVVAATIVALSEATVLAERAGLDVARLLEVFAGGYAGSRLLESRKQRLIEKDYSVSGPAAFMVKDLDFARDEADATNTVAPQLTVLSRVFGELVNAGLGENDMTVVQEYISSLSRSRSERQQTQRKPDQTP